MHDSNGDPQELRAEIDRLRREVEHLRRQLEASGTHRSPGSVADELLEALTEVLPSAIYIYREGEVLWANDFAFELVGLDAASARPSDLLHSLTCEDRELVKGTAAARHRGEEVPTAYEVQFQTVSGEAIWVLLCVRTIEYHGRPASLAVAVDISERKQIEDYVRESRARLSAILESTSDYVLLSDETGTPVYFNRAYREVMKEMLGIDMRPGLKPHELLPDESERARWEEFHRRVLSGEQFVVEYSMPDRSGSLRHFEHSFYPIFEEGRVTGFCEFTHETTDRKNAETTLSRARIEESERLRKIAGGLSHEIYNALYPANASLHQLRGRLSRPEENVAIERETRSLDMAARAIQRALDITESVRLFSKLDKIEHTGSTRILDSVVDVTEQNRERIHDLGVTVDVYISKQLRVFCPESHLYSIFGNLVSNALDAMADASRKELTISAEYREGFVALTIEDTGVGIGREEREQIFEPYFTTKLSYGTGLGLAIVQRIVELCDGRIELQSQPGQGTTFRIEIPGELKS